MVEKVLRKIFFKPRVTFSSLKKLEETKSDSKLLFFDIAANLSDDTYFGNYHGKKVHDPDVDEVIERARGVGVKKLLFAAGNIKDAEVSHELSLKSSDFYCTVGVHPCRANEVEKDGRTQKEYFDEVDRLITKYGSKCVAVGECGLDYDRLEYSSKEDQLKQFPPHFDLAEKHKLPMYLHNRNTGSDFYDLVKQNRKRFPTGVVHSFTGTLDELKEIIALDLYVGINGCSLKTEENLEVVKKIPLDRLMLETDCPYCDIKNSHASSKYVKTKFPAKPKEKIAKGFLVKGRNEPCMIKQVSEVLAAILNLSEEEITNAAYQNTLKMFGLKD